MKDIIESFDPEAFYSVEDVKYASATGTGSFMNNTGISLNRLLRVRKAI